ncbi:MAG: dephospho-CoA kinase [Alphaproteobacteria bacterium]
MLVVGLTGSIGMGKTETAKLFAQEGIPVYDADTAVHALYERGGAAVGPVAKAFPGSLRDGRIDRTILSRRVASDDAAFRRLENIVHPLVAQARERFLAEAQRKGAEIVVLDIPLLFETGGEKHMDAVVVVTAPADVQRERVLARPGMTLEKLEAIHARQVPDSEKRAKADFVVDTGKGHAHAAEAVKEIVAELRARANRMNIRPQAMKARPRARSHARNRSRH